MKEMICRRGYKVVVLDSYAGYYIGTLDEEFCPNCRISSTYYKTKEEANKDLENRSFVFRYSAENIICNCGKGCID